MADYALALVDEGNAEGARRLLGKLCQSWADTAECELAHHVGSSPAVLGARGLGPQLVWKSILAKDSQVRFPGHRAIRWHGQQLRALIHSSRADAESD
eukprot:1947536-Pyramimonas_sp.AAC.1